MGTKNLQETMPAARPTSRMRQAFDSRRAAFDLSEAGRQLPIRSFVAFSAVCVGAMMFAGTFSSADCRVAPIPLVPDKVSEVSISLSVGTSCTILVQPGSLIVEKIVIGTPPERGTLMLRGRTGVVYRPHPGSRGEDSFAFSLNSRSGPTSATSTIRVRARIG